MRQDTSAHLVPDIAGIVVEYSYPMYDPQFGQHVAQGTAELQLPRGNRAYRCCAYAGVILKGSKYTFVRGSTGEHLLLKPAAHPRRYAGIGGVLIAVLVLDDTVFVFACDQRWARLTSLS